MFSGTYLTDAELYAPMEANLRRLTREGFTLRQAVVGLGALYSYTSASSLKSRLSTCPRRIQPEIRSGPARRRVNKELYPLPPLPEQ